MANFCTNCGQKLSTLEQHDNDTLCSGCGEALANARRAQLAQVERAVGASSGDFPQEILSRIREQDVRIGDILAEVRHFTAVSGILFGFLLTVSVAYTAQVPWIIPRVLLILALVCTGSATLIFILPPLYHHLRFPMDQKQTLQFFWRSHKFILWGIVPLYAGVYFSVFLALYNVIGALAAVIATLMVLIPFVAYELRKIGDPKELR
jgi:hypothetical protein